MKPIGQLKILNQMPYILMKHEDLSAVQHIVKIAPKEAQWFHRVEKVTTGNNLVYKIYEMYIPEQYVSAVEVESDPMMLVSFYKELKEKHGAKQANNILKNMTAWSHSHHDMGVSPSGQDRKQFHEQCTEAEKQGITLPQVMMIFNRKDQYYCRLWDPEIGIEYENLDITVGSYDFSWINKEAEEKFKKKIITRSKVWGTTTGKGNTDFLDFHQFEMFQTPTETKSVGKKKNTKRKLKKEKFSIAHWRKSEEYLRIENLEDGIHQALKKIDQTEATEDAMKLINLIKTYLTDDQFLIFSILLDGSEEQIWELEEQLPIACQATIEDTIIAFHGDLTDGIVTAEQITQGMASAIACDKADSPETAEQILDAWLGIYYSSLNESETPPWFSEPME